MLDMVVRSVMSFQGVIAILSAVSSSSRPRDNCTKIHTAAVNGTIAVSFAEGISAANHDCRRSVKSGPQIEKKDLHGGRKLRLRRKNQV